MPVLAKTPARHFTCVFLPCVTDLMILSLFGFVCWSQVLSIAGMFMIALLAITSATDSLSSLSAAFGWQCLCTLAIAVLAYASLRTSFRGKYYQVCGELKRVGPHAVVVNEQMACSRACGQTICRLEYTSSAELLSKQISVLSHAAYHIHACMRQSCRIGWL